MLEAMLCEEGAEVGGMLRVRHGRGMRRGAVVAQVLPSSISNGCWEHCQEPRTTAHTSRPHFAAMARAMLRQFCFEPKRPCATTMLRGPALPNAELAAAGAAWRSYASSMVLLSVKTARRWPAPARRARADALPDGDSRSAPPERTETASMLRGLWWCVGERQPCSSSKHGWRRGAPDNPRPEEAARRGSADSWPSPERRAWP